MNMKKNEHPLIQNAHEELKAGKISRREFVKLACLLGVSVSSAKFLVGCTPKDNPIIAKTVVENASSEITRGGTLRVARQVFRVDHPARFSTAVQEASAWRHVFEYLTIGDADGNMSGWLLESWEPSDDLLTWKLNLRKGIKWSDGRDFTADDVIFTFEEWLNVDVGSSMIGVLDYLSPGAAKKIDDYTIELHLDTPSISVAEDLYQYPAMIIPNGFGGDLTLEPVGTGPFIMEEFVPGERARLVRRENYWQMGGDGKPLPYLDEIVFIDLGNDRTADATALATGEVDTSPEPTIQMWEMAQNNDRLLIHSGATANTRLLRVRVDQEPWTDNNVRLALKHCHKRQSILDKAYRGQGTIGNDSHVSLAQPDCSGEVDPLPYDVEKAKDYLTKAGYPNGLAFELIVNNEEGESLAYAQILQEDAKAAGFDITVNPMPPNQYWEGWDQFNASITWWSHRPLAHMCLSLGYTSDDAGNPVPWNESKWTDEEFEEILAKAKGTVDINERKKLIKKLETIQKERGSICTPFFLNVFTIIDKKFHGLETLPDELPNYHKVWKEA